LFARHSVNAQMTLMIAIAATTSPPPPRTSITP
jgi:hypothetical protein